MVEEAEPKKEKPLFRDISESLKEYTDFLPVPFPGPPIPIGLAKEASGGELTPPLPLPGAKKREQP